MVNDIPIQMRKSVEIEHVREKLQAHLVEVKQDIQGMIQIIVKQLIQEHG